MTIATPERLGDLYDELADMLAANGDFAFDRRELSRLEERYGTENVAFMIRTISADRGGQ